MSVVLLSDHNNRPALTASQMSHEDATLPPQIVPADPEAAAALAPDLTGSEALSTQKEIPKKQKVLLKLPLLRVQIWQSAINYGRTDLAQLACQIGSSFRSET